MPPTRAQRPIQYRDRQRRVWYVSEVARLKLVSAAIDGPSHFLVIRFEREGEERFTRWIGGEDWRDVRTLNRMFELATRPVHEHREDETGVGPAPAESVRFWCEMVKSMGPDELESFERRTYRAWDCASLADLTAAIRRRRAQLGG